VSFSASKGGLEMVAIDAGYVDSRLAELAQNEDLSRYVLVATAACRRFVLAACIPWTRRAR
jgi:hypothetical protein